jgi:hypothetical protein
MNKILLTTIVPLMLFTASVKADAGSMTLEQMISASTAIILGKVTNILTISPTTKLAEVQVLERIKGPRHRNTFYYVIQSGGLACDITTADVGETAIFLFKKGKPLTGYSPSQASKIRSLTGKQELVKLLHLGRGRLAIKEIGRERYIFAPKKDGDIVLPTAIRLYDYPDPAYSYMGMAKVTDVIAFLKSYAQK